MVFLVSFDYADQYFVGMAYAFSVKIFMLYIYFNYIDPNFILLKFVSWKVKVFLVLDNLTILSA